MPRIMLGELFRFLRRECAAAGEEVADGALLERFLDQRDEVAFEALVQRHGPMVLGVCQRVTGDSHAAEDAFQATFLVLARNAGAIRKQASVSSWLFGVAQRIACKARAQAATRRNREKRAVTMRQTESLDEFTWQELRAILDEEIGQLPAKYQAVVVLCHLESKSYDQAARELGLAKSTLARRLGKALELLRVQLTRRGLALSAGALATALTEKAIAAPVAALSAINIVKAASSVAAGQSVPAGVLSTHAIALAEEAMKTMIYSKVKLVLAISAALGLAVGAAFAGYGAWVSEPPPEGKQPAIAQGITGKKDSVTDPLPPGAVVRLGEDRWLHDVTANFASFLPDGKSVVTACDDGTIRVFAFPSGKEIRRIAPPAKAPTWSYITGAALSRDGKRIATRHGRTDPDILIHDLTTGRKVAGFGERFAGPKGSGYGAMAFSPDGKHLAVVSHTAKNGARPVHIWDWAKGLQISELPAGAIPYKNVDGDFSPDGKTHAVIQSDDAVTLVDASTGKETGKLLVKKMAASPWKLVSPVFSTDGSKLYVYAQSLVQADVDPAIKFKPAKLKPRRDEFGRNEGFLLEWDVATRKLLRKCEAKGESIKSLSPDGNVAILSGVGPSFFDLATGKDMTPFIHRALNGIRFLSDGKSVLTRRGQSMEKWDAVSGKNLGPIHVPKLWAGVPTFSGQVISPDGRLLASFHQRNRRSDDGKLVPFPPAELALLDVSSGKEIRQLSLQPATAGLTLHFAPHGQMLAIRQPGLGKVELYEVPSTKLLHTLTLTAQGDKAFINFPQTMYFSPDGKMFTAFADPDTLGIWDTATGQRIGSLSTPPAVPNPKVSPLGHPVQSGALSPDNRCMALHLRDGTVVLYELATAQARTTLGEKQRVFAQGTRREISSGAFSPDGKLLVQTGRNNLVHLWDTQTGREVATFKGHTDPVNAVAFAPDGKTVASASADSTALIWDVAKIKRPAAPVKVLQRGELDKHWQTLAGQDAAKAFEAIGSLTAAPMETVTFLKDRLKPARPDEPKTTGLLLHSDALRAHRAVEVLERIGTPQARQVLQTLAAGAPGALVTTSAHAALKR